MRFKNQKHSHQLPELNLVPMLDVLMTVLTFFIVVSMTLTLEQGVQIQLPDPQASSPAQPPPEPLIAELTPQGILLSNQPATKEQAMQQVKAFLSENPRNVVALKASSQVPYEQVVQLLGDLKDAGGDRVSLALE